MSESKLVMGEKAKGRVFRPRDVWALLGWVGLTFLMVGGFDFAGDDYTGDNEPNPDPDPLDCDGHGSHVAGIAAGLGVLTNGNTYTGSYTQGMDFARFALGPGVAPEAQQRPLPVSGRKGGLV